MKYIFLLLISFTANASLKLVSSSGATDADGAVTLSIKIPGTFTYIDKTASGFSGRTIDHADLFWGNPVAGDRCSNMRVTDDDGKIPVPARAIFPDYPLIKTRDDSVDSSFQGLFTRPGAMTVFTPPPRDAVIPSELYLKLDCQKATATADEKVYVNIFWDDGT